jgi:hypothetical protein
MRYGNIVLGSAVAMALLAILCMAGEMDYQDALISEQHTCAMVRDGIWPAEQAANINCADPVQVAIHERQR